MVARKRPPSGCSKSARRREKGTRVASVSHRAEHPEEAHGVLVEAQALPGQVAPDDHVQLRVRGPLGLGEIHGGAEARLEAREGSQVPPVLQHGVLKVEGFLEVKTWRKAEKPTFDFETSAIEN